MKKLLFFIAVLCALLPACAQYESFFGGESWEYNVVYRMTCKDYEPNALGGCCRTFSFAYHRDDTARIGEKTYYKTNTYDVFLREDTTTGRLYGRYSNAETDDEHVLCDLSLSVGDTFVIPGGLLTIYGDRPMLVDSVTYLFGKKVIHLKALQEEDDYYFGAFNAPYMHQYDISLRFMEGVGPIFGIVPTFEFSFENHLGLLLCMHKDDTLYYMTHETLGCNQYGTGIPEHSQSTLQIYPNPADNLLHIELPGAGIRSVVLYDLQGRVVETGRAPSLQGETTTLNLRNVPAGVYLLRVTDGEGKEYERKVVRN